MVTQQVEQLARQSYFDALAELFVAPDHADTYDRLRDALHAVAGLAAEVGVDCRELEAALEAPLPSPEEVAAEYGALFSTGEIPLPLLESAWTEDAATPEACRAAYEKAGLGLTGDFGMPYDHITLEFAFLSVLVLKGAEGEAAGADADAAEGEAGAFFAAHPAKWLSALSKALVHRPDAKFFRTVGLALAAIVSIEHWRREDRK